MTKDSVTRSLLASVDVVSFVVFIIAYVLSLTFLFFFWCKLLIVFLCYIKNLTQPHTTHVYACIRTVDICAVTAINWFCSSAVRCYIILGLTACYSQLQTRVTAEILWLTGVMPRTVFSGHCQTFKYFHLETFKVWDAVSAMSSSWPFTKANGSFGS